MSRNFELLQLVQEERELFTVPPITKPLPGVQDKTHCDFDARAREEILRLVQRLFLATAEQDRSPIRRVAFCGVESWESSTVLCNGIARSLAEQVQAKVCVIDTSSRVVADPILGVEPIDVSLVAGSKSTRKHLQRVRDNLWLVSNSVARANDDSLSPARMRAVITDLGEEFAYTLISAPPLAKCNDALVLGTLVDGVVLVLEANSTRRMTALWTKRALDAANIKILGTVLNNRTFPIPEKVYRWLW